MFVLLFTTYPVIIVCILIINNYNTIIFMIVNLSLIIYMDIGYTYFMRIYCIQFFE